MVENYIKKIRMSIYSYVIFILLSIFAIGLLIFLWLKVYALGNQDIFIITSIFISIMIVFIVGFAVINIIFSENNRKQALLTYAYDEALKKLEADREINFSKLAHDIDKKIQRQQSQSQPQQQQPPQQSQSLTIQNIFEEHRYYKKAITKIFETYCQNITSK